MCSARDVSPGHASGMEMTAVGRLRIGGRGGGGGGRGRGKKGKGGREVERAAGTAE